jgi:hypothetical protein
MPHSAYHFDGQSSFSIEQYNDLAAFSSFLPGIAGTTGRPAWAFYVNRGQAIASFGVRNKDDAILEFYPADKAYQLTASRCFRTFLKVHDGPECARHEPFQRGAASDVLQRLHVSPHEVSVEEINPALGLSIRVDSFTLPEAALAGLVRRVTLTNTGTRAKCVDIVDGLPQILPYGINQWCVKYMSRTSEALTVVEGVAQNSPFYRLKMLAGDNPVVQPVLGGNFFAGFLESGRTHTLVDAEKIFGRALDFSVPEKFYADETLEFERQVAGNRTPSAFQALTLQLAPAESRTFYGLYGQAPSWRALQKFLGGISGADYFEAKREVNRQLVHGLTQRAFTATALPIFDAYARQCYLDNGLRGGFSTSVPGGAHLHLYGRKHGDLERDYNDFLLLDTPYSEGNGDFRDLLQNRRTDLFFDPTLGSRNIRYFFQLIQPDGFNPMALRNSRYVVVDPSAFNSDFAKVPGLEKLLAAPFKYAQLWEVLRAQTSDVAPLMTEILAAALEEEDAEFEKGYWSDHWTYLVDLLEAFAAIYPDRVTDLFAEEGYSFFDPTHFVLPRSRKHVMTARGVRQYGAVEVRKEKQALIQSRTQFSRRVRDQAGRGEVVTTTLLGKVLTLVANKLASLDPCGIGIEMEADRPGWCDAMNGLPGLFGSSVNETIELKRLVDFTRRALKGAQGRCPLPLELANFLQSLQSLLLRHELTADDFWHASHDLKEAYREQVFMGFAGTQQAQPYPLVLALLRDVSRYLDAAIDRARSPEGITTYYAFEAEEFEQRHDGTVQVLRFEHKPLPLFLEGFVHAMRVADSDEVRRLYDAVRASELFDKKLGMYRLNVPLGENAMEFGRVGIFNYGWLDNGSVFLHMHAKFVLEMARGGLIEEFYAQLHDVLIPFRDPAQYKRSTTENVSFIVSSGFCLDEREHGRGCVARLSGSTVEFLHLWTHLFLGATPFVYEKEQLVFRPEPALPKDFFSSATAQAQPFGSDETLPKNSVACALLGNTLLVYLNPQHIDTFGPGAAAPCRFTLYGRDGSVQTVQGRQLEGATAQALRAGEIRRVDVELN